MPIKFYKVRAQKTLKIASMFFLVFILQGCSSSKVKYRKEYAKVWKELIKSQAWKDAIGLNREDIDSESRMPASEQLLVLSEPGSFKGIASPWFEDKYGSLVSRAYFKIISEAEKADKRLQDDHAYWTQKSVASKTMSKELKRRLDIANKKYEAHKNMLLGLKSWNIFSENRTGDLEYFKAENEEAVYKMFLQGLREEKMISYLVFKLADLYHFE